MNAKEFVESARQNYPSLPNAKALALLEADEEFRFAVCEELNKTVAAPDRELVRYITKLNIQTCNDSWESLDPFRLCGLLLYKIGNVEDSVLLWQVKELNFDTACALDVQMLTGAGIDETIAYLRSLDTKFALDAARRIEVNRDIFPDEDFVDVWETYFGYRTSG